jgi:hypothetical protein
MAQKQTLSNVDASVLIKVLLTKFNKCESTIAIEMTNKLRDVTDQIRKCDKEIKIFAPVDQPRYLLQPLPEKADRASNKAVSELCNRISTNTNRYLKLVDHDTRIMLLQNEYETTRILKSLQQMCNAMRFKPILKDLPEFSYFAGVYKF